MIHINQFYCHYLNSPSSRTKQLVSLRLSEQRKYRRKQQGGNQQYPHTDGIRRIRIRFTKRRTHVIQRVDGHDQECEDHGHDDAAH